MNGLINVYERLHHGQIYSF